jgi:hypothetical protein
MLPRSLMSVLRVIATAMASTAVAVSMLAANACGPDSVGIDDCRDIEQARCEAAEPCGIVDDVAACKRFYRDHCLHGLALEEKPGENKVTQCVRAIEQAGACARQGAEQTPAACQLQIAAPVATVCDAISEPETLQSCQFLNPPAEPLPPPPDAAADAPADAAGQ